MSAGKTPGFYGWFKAQPRAFWCPLCEVPVTRWHEHWGPRQIWRPGMVEPVIREGVE